ncbi:MAG: PD-(D/E)XK nuclease family protein [Planctomycetota bacterium]
MAVQFILGRSGSGKTGYCIEAIVEALSIAGYNRLHVLSFDRLQFLLSSKNTARAVLSRIGRQMIVQRILNENKSKLRIFEQSSVMTGLSQRMARTIAELHEYAKSPQDIDGLVSELQKDKRNSLAALKFADIGLILREYLEFVEGKFVDPDLQLARACRAVTQASFIKGARLWVDGFAGFTAAEHAILAEMLKAAGDAQIALCLDPSNIDFSDPASVKLDEVSLFGPTERTYASLIETIKQSKLELADPIILSKGLRFSRSQPLAHIERNIFEIERPRSDSADGIRIVSAPNARGEVQFVARHILELVRDKDCRYRDIAVIASDIDSYQHYIRADFDDYGIPFFVDKRRPLNQHPVVQLVSSALQAVTSGFTHTDIFAYLKTDLATTTRAEVDMLENYCLAFGISARDWQSDEKWHFADPESGRFDERQINRVRHKAIKPLLELQDMLCPAGDQGKTVSPEQFTRAIFAFLDALDVSRTIAGWISCAHETNDLAAADEHQQFYNKFLDTFDELAEVFAGRTMTAQDYLGIVNSAFSQLTMALIPPTLDQVLVGSIERSRHPDLKAVFLIGATQRQFPVPISSDSILTDDDRIAAESVNFQLAPTSSQTLTERQYLAYIAFTRPSQFMYVTYPSTDNKGSAVPRSQFIGDLESLFEDLRQETIASEYSDIEKVYSEAELADLLCTSLSADNVAAKGDCRGLLDSICSDQQLRQLGSDVLFALNYNNSAQLDAGVVREIFGRRIRSSATQLSTFAACPYQHFARYTLRLREREEFKFEPLDLGRFYHRILDKLTRQLNTRGKDFTTVDKDDLLLLLREEITELIKEDSFISNFVSRRGYNEFIIKSAAELLEDCVLAISEIMRAGSFRPRLSEVSFGTVKETRETLGECEFSLEDNRLLALDGKIDRLDIATIEGRDTAIVFDYKRRDPSFGWSRFYHGLDMQLPIYMLAIRNTASTAATNVAGAFYMPIEVSPGKITLARLSRKADSFDYKAKGIFDGRYAQQLDATASRDSRYYNFYVTKDGQPYGSYSNRGALKSVDFEKVLQFAEEKIVRLAGEIASGEISVRPYRLSQNSPCGYCKYKAVCRFDWQINDYNFLESVNKVQAIEAMGANDG